MTTHKTLIYTLISFNTLFICGCRGHKDSLNESPNNDRVEDSETVPSFNVMPYEGPGLFEGGSVHALPKAVIYKTNGNYDNNVAVTLNATRTSIISYPAPSDVSAKSSPVKVEGGWLLDRRGGIGLNTAFLRYTYEDYSKLQHAPSPSQLMQEIIPDARVTATRILDISASQAIAQPSLVDSL